MYRHHRDLHLIACPQRQMCIRDRVYENYFKKVNNWSNLLEPFDLKIYNGGGGADIGPLKSQKGLLANLQPDSQRYFDYHHTRIDQFGTVNKRELLLGAAAMTSLVYLVDKYGLD